MARIFITGSADGLGQLTAASLIQQGHQVVLHARNHQRGQDALKKNPGAEAVLIADLTNIEATINLGLEVNRLGKFDAVIHIDDTRAVKPLDPWDAPEAMEAPETFPSGLEQINLKSVSIGLLTTSL